MYCSRIHHYISSMHVQPKPNNGSSPSEQWKPDVVGETASDSPRSATGPENDGYTHVRQSKYKITNITNKKVEQVIMADQPTPLTNPTRN